MARVARCALCGRSAQPAGDKRSCPNQECPMYFVDLFEQTWNCLQRAIAAKVKGGKVAGK